MVMEVVHEDLGEGNMGCVNHQYKNSTPGGICVFWKACFFIISCSRHPFNSRTASTQSPHPSRSPSYIECINSLSVSELHCTTRGKDSGYLGDGTTRRSRLPFIFTHGRQKPKDVKMACSDSNNIMFKRSMPTTTPTRGVRFLAENHPKDHTHRTNFLSFLYMPNLSSATPRTVCRSSSSRDKKKENFVVVDETEDGSPDEAAFDRKILRSRSVGCGSRSFSGDFFEKISTGFGDCTSVEWSLSGKQSPKLPQFIKLVSLKE